MAKTIMVSNEAYDRLKKIKERRNESFSEVIMELKEEKKMKNLEKFFGILRDDKEYDRIMKDVKKGWDKWNKRYA